MNENEPGGSSPGRWPYLMPADLYMVSLRLSLLLSVALSISPSPCGGASGVCVTLCVRECVGVCARARVCVCVCVRVCAPACMHSLCIKRIRLTVWRSCKGKCLDTHALRCTCTHTGADIFRFKALCLPDICLLFEAGCTVAQMPARRF